MSNEVIKNEANDPLSFTADPFLKSMDRVYFAATFAAVAMTFVIIFVGLSEKLALSGLVQSAWLIVVTLISAGLAIITKSSIK